MNKYFFIKESFEDNQMYITSSNLTDEEENIMIHCPLSTNKRIEFYYEGQVEKDYFTNKNGTIPIISKKAKKLFDNLMHEFKYIPVDIKKSKSDKSNLGEYFIIIPDSISFIDYEKSTYKGIKEKKFIVKIEKLFINESSLKGNNFIRFRELKTSFIISNGLKKSFEENNITGCKFINIEDFRFPYMP